MKESRAVGALVQHAQYAERVTRHGIIKCYREAVIGPYRCHRYGWWEGRDYPSSICGTPAFWTGLSYCPAADGDFPNRPSDLAAG